MKIGPIGNNLLYLLYIYICFVDVKHIMLKKYMSHFVESGRTWVCIHSCLKT